MRAVNMTLAVFCDTLYIFANNLLNKDTEHGQIRR